MVRRCQDCRRQGHLSQLFKILQMAGASSQRIKVGCWLPLAAQVSLQHVTNEAFRCGAKDPSVLSLCEWLACTASPSETRVRVPLRNVKLSNSEMWSDAVKELFRAKFGDMKFSRIPILISQEASKIPQEIHLSHNDLTTGSLEATFPSRCAPLCTAHRSCFRPWSQSWRHRTLVILCPLTSTAHRRIWDEIDWTCIRWQVKSLRHRPNFPYWIRIEDWRISCLSTHGWTMLNRWTIANQRKPQDCNWCHDCIMSVANSCGIRFILQRGIGCPRASSTILQRLEGILLLPSLFEKMNSRMGSDRLC